MPLVLEIIVDGGRWNRIPGLNNHLQKAVAVLSGQLPKHLRMKATATMLLTSDAKIRRLNWNFRGIDKATNVLSFPQYNGPKLPKNGKGDEVVYLGDIALGYQYIVAESNKYHKILINHTIHLMIYGILHLFGYDHMSGAAARHMEGLEQRVLAKLKLPDPYTPQQREPKAR